MKNKVSFDSTLSKFGIGLFETIKVEEEPVRVDLHIDRILNSIKELNLDFKYDKVFLEKEIMKYIRENNISNKAIRLTLFDEGYNISTRNIPYTDEIYENGFKLNISPIKRGDSIVNRHKTTNYFESIYTKNNAIKNNYDDGLFIDINNNVLECSMSNIFFIKKDKIFTPSSKLSILNGTTKRRIIDICEELDVRIEEVEIKIEDIKKFKFAFISNALMGIIRVASIEDINYDKKNYIFSKIEKQLQLNKIF